MQPLQHCCALRVGGQYNAGTEFDTTCAPLELRCVCEGDTIIVARTRKQRICYCHAHSALHLGAAEGYKAYTTQLGRELHDKIVLAAHTARLVERSRNIAFPICVVGVSVFTIDRSDVIACTWRRR